MANPTPPKLEIACPESCSLHPNTIGAGVAAALLAIRENGAGIRVFHRRAGEILGHPVPITNVQRHIKHYRELDTDAPDEPEPSGKVTDLEILDRIINAGARNAKNWKPTIGDTLKAMEMKLRLTGNSAFEDMLDAMAEAATGEDDEVEAPESVAAVLSEDERVVEDEEPLAEPAY